MKKIITIVILFINLYLTAQDTKFSIELNYLFPSSDDLEKETGIIGGSLKYRFKETSTLLMGVSYTFDYTTADRLFIANIDLKSEKMFNHINLFGEIKLNGSEKIHPFIAAGYSLLLEEYDFIKNSEIATNKNNLHGFNFNVGLLYNLSNKFYIHTYFHFIRVFSRTRFITIDNKLIGESHNQLKIGLGYRF